jgi:MSHA biogenesis protein MshP
MNAILRIRRQAGVGLVTAIFLLVVLAGLGVAMVGIFTAQQASSNLDLLGARAYQAARAGLEWGIYQRMRNNSCGDPATGTASVAAFTMPAGTSLSGFRVIVKCEPKGTGSLARAIVTSTACNFPNAAGDACLSVNTNAESVRRTLEAEL